MQVNAHSAYRSDGPYCMDLKQVSLNVWQITNKQLLKQMAVKCGGTNNLQPKNLERHRL